MMTVVALPTSGDNKGLVRCFWHPDTCIGYGEMSVPQRCLTLESGVKEE